MKIKFGALVVAGRGKIGGHVASRNRGGAYLRTKVTPINPSTEYQVNVRNRFAALSTAWRALTVAQRLAWNTAVSDFARTDIFGDLKNPSGFNLHQKLNNNLVNIGKAPILVPPLPEAVDSLATLSLAADFTLQTMAITYTAAIAADHSVMVFATPAISPGISFVKSEFRQFDVMVAADASPFSIEAEYIAKFGAIGAVDMQIFIQMVQVNWATGQAGIPQQAKAIITV